MPGLAGQPQNIWGHEQGNGAVTGPCYVTNERQVPRLSSRLRAVSRGAAPEIGFAHIFRRTR
jgi:hypothetical protein